MDFPITFPTFFQSKPPQDIHKKCPAAQAMPPAQREAPAANGDSAQLGRYLGGFGTMMGLVMVNDG